jgi:hypothetical protein
VSVITLIGTGWTAMSVVFFIELEVAFEDIVALVEAVEGTR